MTFQCPFLTYFDLRMTFPDHKDGLDIHAIRIRIEFGNESYAYHVYLAVFQNYDPKMTSFDLLDDLGWPQETHYWIQNKICSRFICISCEFGNVSDFWPQNDLFWPQRWPRVTLRCTPSNSKQDLQSIHMHIMCIWPYFQFLTPKWPFWPLRWPRMTSRYTRLNSEEHFQSIHMHIMRIRHEICIISIFDP